MLNLRQVPFTNIHTIKRSIVAVILSFSELYCIIRRPVRTNESILQIHRKSLSLDTCPCQTDNTRDEWHAQKVSDFSFEIKPIRRKWLSRESPHCFLPSPRLSSHFLCWAWKKNCYSVVALNNFHNLGCGNRKPLLASPTLFSFLPIWERAINIYEDIWIMWIELTKHHFEERQAERAARWRTGKTATSSSSQI